MVAGASTSFDRQVLGPLRRLGRRIRLHIALDASALLAAATVGLVLGSLLLDRTLRLSLETRVVQLVAMLAALAVLSWRRGLLPISAPLPLTALALRVEQNRPGWHNRLVTAVEMATSRSDWFERYSPQLRQAVLEQVQREAGSIETRQLLDSSRRRRSTAMLLASLAVLALLPAMAPEAMAIWFDRNLLLQDVNWPQRNRLVIEGLQDNRLHAARGEDITVSARVADGFEPPSQAHIEFVGPGSLHGRQQMPAITAPEQRFVHRFEKLEQSLRCRVVGGDAETQWFELVVVERPKVAEVSVRIEPPAYTLLEPYRMRGGQSVLEVLAGSSLQFTVTTDRPVVRATLLRELDGQSGAVGELRAVDKLNWRGTEKPQASCAYLFELIDEQGWSSLSERQTPTRVAVRLVKDRAPSVRLQAGGAGEMIAAEAVLPLRVEAADDYALAKVQLNADIADSHGKATHEEVPGFVPPAREYAREIEWSLAQHGVQAGDKLTLLAEAHDTDDVSGPNVGASAPLVFRVVSREEMLAELGRREQEYRQYFERLVRQQEELYADLLSPRQADSQDANRRHLLELARRQRDYTGRCTAMHGQFTQLLTELRISRVATLEAEERLLREVIEPMAELTRQQMPAAAVTLEQASQKLDDATLTAARNQQSDTIARMNAILKAMLKWEGYQEAVTLLQEVLRMQKQVNQDTEQRIEAEILGVPREQQ